MFFNKKNDVYIYGAGSLGSIIGKKMINSGFRIKAFVDKRALEIPNLHNLPIVEIANLKSFEPDSCFIVIAVKDVFEHEKIKVKLIEMGFKYILYRPIAVIDGVADDCEVKINQQYDLLIESNSYVSFDIPLVSNINYKISYLKKYMESDTNIVCGIPSEYIYTNYDYKKNNSWGDICILGYMPHIELFRCFMGENGASISKYMKFCELEAKKSGVDVTKLWKENVIRNRYNVYLQMRRYYESDFDFFIRNAPNAVLNDNGYFNLTSGKHRAAFLTALRNSFIPCRISKQDYLRWCDLGVVEEYIPVDENYILQKTLLTIIEQEVINHSLMSNDYPCYKGCIARCGKTIPDYVKRHLSKFGVEILSTDLTEGFIEVVLDGKILRFIVKPEDEFEFYSSEYRILGTTVFNSKLTIIAIGECD